jgi:F-type H+-transporting ATPase subunit delta
MAQDPQARDARTAREIDVDVSALDVGAVYAEALIGAAESAGLTESVLSEFDSLVTDVLDAFPALERVLASGAIAHEEKALILGRTLGAQASPLLLDFLKVVARHGRLDCLRAIHRQAHAVCDRLRKRVRVEVSTVAPLSGELAERIVTRLRNVLDGEPVIDEIVDPDLIGGVVLRVGDTVYDASLATQLEGTRQRIIQRTSHEIQTRRDRFRYSPRD